MPQKTERAEVLPIVKWAGGKTQLLGDILPLIQEGLTEDSTYFEPFLGGGAVFFALGHRSSVVSDINVGLINLYSTVAIDLERFWTLCQQLEVRYNSLSDVEQSALYYQYRDEYNASERIGIDQALRFLFLNKACFNGLHRENAKGGFNVPWGKRRILSLGNLENLVNASALLAASQVTVRSFAETIDAASKGDVVYFDPPYVPLSVTSSFTSYSWQGFSIADQTGLAETFRTLDRRGVRVVLSNSSAPEVSETLYPGFNIREVQAKRAVSASTRGRETVTEFLITNF
jgi:DNA adenine methylase